MSSPLIERMLQKHNLTSVHADNCESFLQAHGKAVLFFAEDPARYPESNDVAMVLPELLKHFSGLSGAIVDSSFEHQLQGYFDFTRWPALAFFVSGEYRGAITGIHNWEDYLREIPALLQARDHNAIPVINLQESSSD